MRTIIIPIKLERDSLNLDFDVIAQNIEIDPSLTSHLLKAFKRLEDIVSSLDTVKDNFVLTAILEVQYFIHYDGKFNFYEKAIIKFIDLKDFSNQSINIKPIIIYNK